MTHPTDDELEAMAVRLDCYSHDWRLRHMDVNPLTDLSPPEHGGHGPHNFPTGGPQMTHEFITRCVLRWALDETVIRIPAKLQRPTAWRWDDEELQLLAMNDEGQYFFHVALKTGRTKVRVAVLSVADDNGRVKWESDIPADIYDAIPKKPNKTDPDLTAPEAVERLIAEIPGVKDTPQEVWDLQERTFATLRALSAQLNKKYDDIGEMYIKKAELEAALADMTRRRDHWRAIAEGQDFTRVYLETCAERDALRAELAEAVKKIKARMPNPVESNWDAGSKAGLIYSYEVIEPILASLEGDNP